MKNRKESKAVATDTWESEGGASRAPLETTEDNMPRKKYLREVGNKEQRQYAHIKESEERSGRYGARAKEVAARTVLKRHKEMGHSEGE